MAIPGKRSDPVRLFVRRLGLLALAVIVFGASSAVWDVHKKERDSLTLRTQSEAQLLELSTQKNRLEGEIARLQTARGKEETLREHYEMAREGEQLIVIVDSQKQTPDAATTTEKSWFSTFLPFW